MCLQAWWQHLHSLFRLLQRKRQDAQVELRVRHAQEALRGSSCLLHLHARSMADFAGTRRTLLVTLKAFNPAGDIPNLSLSRCSPALRLLRQRISELSLSSAMVVKVQRRSTGPKGHHSCVMSSL